MSQRIQWWMLASGALMLLGAFGPWVTALGMSAAGTDSSNDGWLVVAAALIGGGLCYAARNRRVAGVWALLGGIAGLAVTAYDRGNVQDAINHGGPFAQALAHVGWGLNLALVASASMAIAGVVALTRARSAALPASQPLIGECPYCKEDIRLDALVCPHCRRKVTPLGADGEPDVSAWATVDDPSSTGKDA